MKTEFKGTPAPWKWELHTVGNQLTLIGHGSNYVMDFTRWGMKSAQPRFNCGGFMKNAVELGEVVKGREHHANWYKDIKHPDAQLIAAAPELLEACIKCRELIQAMADRGAYPIELLQENGGEGVQFLTNAIKKALGV